MDVRTANLPLVALTPVAAVVAGGVLRGLQRRLTARLQARQGPPLLQPFLDMGKLLGKDDSLAHPWLAVFPRLQLAAATTAVALFALRADLLVVLFVHAAGCVFFTIGGLCSPSPFSRCAGQRQLWQLLAGETLLFLVAGALYQQTGSFSLTAVAALPQPLLPRLPLLFAAYLLALAVKMRASPFDFAGSDHAHQELVGGVLTDYCGRHLAFAEIAHWLELVLYLAIASLFWATAAAPAVALAVLAFLLVVVLDNVAARLTWRWLLLRSWLLALGLATFNLLLCAR